MQSSEQPETLGEMLRRTRQAAGLTQQGLARRADVSIATLRDLEQGRVRAPRPATIRAISAALDFSPAQVEQLRRTRRRDRSYVQVLGPFRVLTRELPVRFGSVAHRVLLATLALSPNTPIDKGTLIDVLWGSTPPGRANDLLQSHVSRLRNRLRNGIALETKPGGYQLTVGDDQLDLLVFRRYVREARRARLNGDLGRAYHLYTESAAMWRGDPVQDLAELRGYQTAAALFTERRTVVLEYADVARRLVRFEVLLPLLRHLMQIDPLDEAVAAQFMTALAATGQHLAALGVFEGVQKQLADTLGAEPGPEFASARERLLQHDAGPRELAPVSVHSHLPPAVPDFIGRASELGFLVAALSDNPSQTAVPIIVVEGMGGIGKTQLALHFAHQQLAAGRYPDMQLHVDLRGHAERPPADPTAVLGAFLQLLDVPGSQIPAAQEDRAALYRARLDQQRCLVFLDNAANESQVLPLIPASPTNLVVITSRRTLAIDGASVLPLGVLTDDDAKALLIRNAGHRTIDVRTVRAVVKQCGRLPLAIVLAGRQLQTQPDAAGGLSHSRSQLVAGQRGLRTVFDLSYNALDVETRRFFRLLSLHPGDDCTAESAAALAGLQAARARELLDELVDEHMASQITSDRYQLHDLLREYARQRSRADDSAADQELAIRRVLNWYLYGADTAQRTLYPYVPDTTLDPTRRPAGLPQINTNDAGFDWLTIELPNLISAVSVAFEHGCNDVAWQLPVILRHFFERTSRYDDWLNTGNVALAAARRLDDRAGEAAALNMLGIAYGQLGQTTRAIAYFSRGTRIRSPIGPVLKARLLMNRGLAYGHQNSIRRSLDDQRHALRIAEQADEPHQAARIMSNLGWTYSRTGRHDMALKFLYRALDRIHGLDDEVSRSGALQNLGAVLTKLGRYNEAIDNLNQAREIYRRLRFRLYEAETLGALAEALQAARRADEAEIHLSDAREILDQLSHPLAAEITVRISELRRVSDPGSGV